MEWNGYQYEMWEEKGDDRGNGEGWYFVICLGNEYQEDKLGVIEGPFESEGQAAQVLQARIDEMKRELGVRSDMGT